MDYSPDIERAKAVRGLLDGRFDTVRRQGQVDPLAIDVGIGIEAFEAGEVLLGAGYLFHWHADQHQLNRTGTAWGIPVEGD